MAYSTISKPSLHFNTKLYTGNGNDDTAITGINFQPDLVWIKARSQATYDHMVFDSVRGQYKVIRTNLTNADSTDTSGVKSFDTDGFTTNLGGYTNGNGVTFASWNWKANGSGSANTDGSINSTVSANTTAGFSIVSYTGTGANATVGHGLGAVPKMIIIKELNNATNWIVYHTGVGNGGSLQLNTTIATDTDSTFWNSTTPTSSVFTLGSNGNSNGSSDNYIAYCFAEKKGFSKFGSYTGNGNADGSFIYTGFAPSFVIMKRTDNTGAWYTLDNKRPTYNPKDKYLSPDSSNAESTFTFWDFLSNGFKIRNTGTENNASGGNYIYMAFAEEPLVANVGASIPATAR